MSKQVRNGVDTSCRWIPAFAGMTVEGLIVGMTVGGLIAGMTVGGLIVGVMVGGLVVGMMVWLFLNLMSFPNFMSFPRTRESKRAQIS